MFNIPKAEFSPISKKCPSCGGEVSFVALAQSYWCSNRDYKFEIINGRIIDIFMNPQAAVLCFFTDGLKDSMFMINNRINNHTKQLDAAHLTIEQIKEYLRKYEDYVVMT